MKKATSKIIKFEMSSGSERAKDINLYIYDEKTLYQRPHIHGFYEIMFVAKGKLHQKINDQERIISENDIGVLRPEALHTAKKYPNQSLVLYNFEVSIPYFNELCKAFGFSSADEVFTLPESYTRCSSSEALEYIKIITFPALPTSLSRSEIVQTSLKIVVAKILMSFLVNPSHGLSHKKEDSVISTMLSLLEDKNNFTRSIKELCEQTFYTQEHITRLFQKANLNSPNRIHLQKKLQYAAKLLLNSDMKIIDIIGQCGIETVSYFTKAFKREYGFSPSTYKKMYRNNPQQ